ncbi:uncharacterized protein LOC127722471 [Mytilus californianus]|uniref:uncharacterized protein LOC127722471 n=1 Tax=Mytilus californianus TaxID=6549 RepID=UPI002245A826|nr:uncharacterized protein LOC127722471 [Mytilus californianus]
MADFTSHEERTKETQRISSIKRNKWTLVVAFLILCSSVTVGFSMYKLNDMLHDDKEISSMRKDILDIKVQRKKFEDDITLLFVGHSRQNEDLSKSETMIHNITMTFMELTKKISRLTTKCESQTKLHVDMKRKIDDLETDNKKRFGEFEQKQINLKQNLDSMTKAQQGLRNDLKETQSSLQKGSVKSLRFEFRSALSKMEADSRANQNLQKELRSNQQRLLEKISEIKNYI